MAGQTRTCQANCMLVFVAGKDSASSIKIYGCYDGREADPLLCMGKVKSLFLFFSSLYLFLLIIWIRV